MLMIFYCKNNREDWYRGSTKKTITSLFPAPCDSVGRIYFLNTSKMRAKCPSPLELFCCEITGVSVGEVKFPSGRVGVFPAVV